MDEFKTNFEYMRWHAFYLTFPSGQIISNERFNLNWAATWETRIFAYAKTKTQISIAVTAKLISAFVFATSIVQSLSFLNPKFQVSSHLLWLYSPVCVGPGRKPRRPVFWRRGSTRLTIMFFLILWIKSKERIWMSRRKRKSTIWILTSSDTNQAVQLLEMARGLNFWL